MRTTFLLALLSCSCGRTPGFDEPVITPTDPYEPTKLHPPVDAPPLTRSAKCSSTRLAPPLTSFASQPAPTGLTRADVDQLFAVDGPTGSGVLTADLWDDGTVWALVAAGPNSTFASVPAPEGVSVVGLSPRGKVLAAFPTTVGGRIAASPRGVVLVATTLNGTMTIQGTTLTSRGRSDVAYLAFDFDGSLRWTHVVGDEGFDAPKVVETSADGHFLVAADVSSSLLTESLDARDGTVRWANHEVRAVSSSPNHGPAIALVEVAGGAAVVGRFDSFRPPGAAPVTAGLPQAPFVVLYDSSGAVRWTRTAKGTCPGWGSTGANGVSLQGEHLLVSGSFCDSMDLDGVVVRGDGAFLWELDLSSGRTTGGVALGGTAWAQYAVVDGRGGLALLSGNWGGVSASLLRWSPDGTARPPLALKGALNNSSFTSLVSNACGDVLVVVASREPSFVPRPTSFGTSIALQFEAQ